MWALPKMIVLIVDCITCIAVLLYITIHYITSKLFIVV